MPNPLQGICEALEKAAREADVLPASGQATVEESRPDVEEREDSVLARDEFVYDVLGEAGTDGTYPPLYKECPPLTREHDHLFRYFVDGSFSSYFLGTLVAPEWESPLVFGQIGACVVRRQDDGTVRREILETRQILALAKRSDVLWDELNRRSDIVLTNIIDEDQITSAEGLVDLRVKATGKIRWQMHELESEVISQILPKLSSDCWLVADGSLRFEPLQNRLLQSEKIVPVIGVAKSFRRDVRFRYGRGPRGQDLTLYRLLAGLECGCRTAAFSALDGRVVFWYVRLREQKQMDYPLMGVIKAELINPPRTGVSSDLIDRLSRALVAERSVTPHGRDQRWHAHLYPIFLAETAVKNAFYSPEVIRSALLWR